MIKHAHVHSHPVTGPDGAETVTEHGHFHVHRDQDHDSMQSRESRAAHKAGPHEHEHHTTTVTLSVEFEVGTLDDLGLGGFKTSWLDSERDGRDYSLTAGAGVGSPYLEAYVSGGDLPAVYARADIQTLTRRLWDALHARSQEMAAEKDGS